MENDDIKFLQVPYSLNISRLTYKMYCKRHNKSKKRTYCIGNRFPLELSPGGFARPDTVSAATATTQVNTKADVSYTHSNHNYLVKT